MAMMCFSSMALILMYVVFAQSNASETESSPTGLSPSSSIVYLISSFPSTWYNNNSIKILTPADGSKFRVVLFRQQSISFACGFYCVGTCNSYLFSVVAVDGGNLSLLWSANRDNPVKENAVLQLKGDGELLLQESDGTNVWSTNTSGKSIFGMKLTKTGNLALFDKGGTIAWQSKTDLITEDLGYCQHPLICGEYGVCMANQSCSCPQGLDGVQYFIRDDLGCNRITPLSCEPSLHHFLEVKNVTYFNIIDSGAAVPEVKDIDECKQACLQDCSCGGAFFRYEKNVSDGDCYMPSKILSLREGHIPNFNFTSVTFIKVQIPLPETQTKDSLPTSPSGDEGNIAALIVGASIAPLITFCLVLTIVLARLKMNRAVEDRGDYIDQVPGMPAKFLYEDLRVATEDFKERLGSGGFGSVFKGLLADGTRIAVKRLDRRGQGMREFLAEVKTIGSLHHFNLVRLIGFCAEKSNRLLVFECMSNGSLDSWIFYGGQRPCLDWETRKRIILDIAKGLAYLHEECRQTILHLDIKPQNILLDENFNAKVSDFGLSELIGREESQVLTPVRGTPGYLAPEWRESKITVKVDIYSFGILLLEIVTARRNVDRTREESSLQMLRVVQKKAEEDRLIEVVEILDQDTQNHEEEVVRMIRIGAWCLQDDPRRRPPMSVVVKVLEGVMEVDSNIIYKFTHAMTSTSASDNRVCTEPEASILSNPR